MFINWYNHNFQASQSQWLLIKCSKFCLWRSNVSVYLSVYKIWHSSAWWITFIVPIIRGVPVGLFLPVPFTVLFTDTGRSPYGTCISTSVDQVQYPRRVAVLVCKSDVHRHLYLSGTNTKGLRMTPVDWGPCDSDSVSVYAVVYKSDMPGHLY